MHALRTTAIATALVAGSAVSAHAAPVYATDATIVVDGPRGTNNDRDDLSNALGESLGDFFELGLGAVVDFSFGRVFTGPGSVVEVSFSETGPLEQVLIQGGRDGAFTDIATITNKIPGAQSPEGAQFLFSGAFETLRLIDQTPADGRETGGFDVDRISVAAIPVPAAGALMLGALGAFGLMRRRSA